MTRTPLLTTAAVFAAFAVASGCAQRQKTAGEAMLDAPRPTPPAAVAQAPDNTPALPAASAAPETPAAPAAPTTPAAGIVSTQPAPVQVVADPSAAAPGADQAALMRGWRPVTAYYQNGNVIAGPIYKVVPPPPKSNRPVDVQVVDYYGTLLSAGTFFVTPFWMLGTPPLKEVAYHGEEFPPSYTLDDPKDMSDEKIPGIVKLQRR